MQTVIHWLKDRCPHCGVIFHYIEGGYIPKTCNKFDCVFKELHPRAIEARKERVRDANLR